MLTMFLNLSLSAVPAFSGAACLDAYYDLGKNAAAIGLFCEGEKEPARARLVFCKREALLRDGTCTGMRMPVGCGWRDAEDAWECREEGAWPFRARIRRVSETRVRYEFESSFNEGTLDGERIDF